MNLDKLNSWLTLAANIGVLIGLIFLIFELDQSNRIAKYTAENARRTQFLEMNAVRIENPEIIAKLMTPSPELDKAEWVQSLYTARQQTNTWIDAENAVLNGLLSDTTYDEVLTDIDVVLSEMPGLIPAFEYILRAYKVDETSNLQTMRYLAKSVELSKQNLSNELQQPGQKNN